MKIKIVEGVYVDANPDGNAEPSPLQLVKLADKLSQTYRLQGLAELVRQRAQDIHLQSLPIQDMHLQNLRNVCFKTYNRSRTFSRRQQNEPLHPTSTRQDRRVPAGLA